MYDDEDEEFDVDKVEEAEEEDLTDFDTDTIAAAKRRQNAIDEGWSVGQIAQFLESTPSLVEAITDGVFDGPEIKAIITACMERRAVVMGTLGSKPPKKKAAAAHRATGGRARVTGTATVNQAKGTTRYTGAVLGENGVLLLPVGDSWGSRRGYFTAGGRTFSKADMTGRVIRLPKEFGGKWYLGQQLVRVIEVRVKGIEVELVENPEYTHPTSTELKRAAFVPGYRFEIRAEDVEHIFG